MEKVISGIKIEVVQGDITLQSDMQAVVNAANSWLKPGGGVSGAIHRVAGPGLEEECRPMAPINPGEAVITGAHKLPNDYVIHCLGPVYGRDTPENELLMDCYRNSLRLADEKGISSVAFPSISTGIFGYPVKDAAMVAMSAIMAAIPALRHVRVIRIVLFSREDFEAYDDVLPPAGI